MIRKLFTVVALSALPAGLFAALGTGPAQASAPVTFKGSISCGLTGTITFKPPLANSQTTKPTTATFEGTNKLCTGIDGTKLTQGGETLKSSTDSFSFSSPANSEYGSCLGLLFLNAFPAITTTVKWIGTSPIASSKIAFPADHLLPASGKIEYLKGKSAGSFAGSGQMAMQATKISEGNGTVVTFSAANVMAACKASGIADFTLSQPNPEIKPFSKNDNLEVGKAF